MEQIAIISDIHGNITALDEVLRDIESRGIKRIMCLGDLVVKCSAPRECVEKALEKCEVIIKGNCEERGIEAPRIQEHVWNRDKMTPKIIEKISNLPLSYDFYMSGYNIRIMHASPRSVHEKSYFWNFDDDFINRFNIMFENTEYLGNLGKEKPDIVIFGHIHRPMIFRSKNKTLINPGAISNTSDMIEKNGKKYTYGSYLILEGEYGSKKVSKLSYKIVKFTYDYMKEAINIKESDMPNKEEAYLELSTGKYFSRLKLQKEANTNG